MLLSDKLDPDRFRTALICGEPGPLEGDMLALRPVGAVAPLVIRGLGREISPLADLQVLWHLVNVLRAQRPDVVHTHMAKAGTLGRLAARIAGVPIVVHTFHGNVFHGYFGRWQSRAFVAMERSLARITTRIVAISPRQREEIASLGIAKGERLVEIPLGLELRSFLDPPVGSLRRELGVARDVPLVGIVARLVPIKAVDVFIDAAALVAERRPDALFVVVGDGVLRADLERRAADRRLGRRVRFLGWRADLPGIYADLDVVALTSRNEGTPISLIEALAVGRAVVATAVGGVPDLIADGQRGVLVAEGDASGLAQAVLSLLNDPQRRARLGVAGRAHVHPEYDAATLVARIEGLYMDLVATMTASTAPS